MPTVRASLTNRLQVEEWMDHFIYHNGILHAEKVPIPDIAAKVGTPFYVYSTATLERHFRLFEDALKGFDHLVCYAMKAASNQAIIKTLAALGAGMDVVSGGEYQRAIDAGVPTQRIIFSGVGKTRAEMEMIVRGGIRHVNIESEAEMLLLDEVARENSQKIPIAIRINPGVDAKTHSKIATGKSENKFGIPISKAREAYTIAGRLKGLDVIGIDVHIGSQVTDLEPFKLAYQKIADLTKTLRADGHEIKRLDLGGGLGIPYSRSNETLPSPKDYGEMIGRELGHLDCEFEIEPGRLISGNAGLLVSSVIYIKQGEERKFLILDAAMNDLVRPAMYDAYHEIVPVDEPHDSTNNTIFDVVGPVCETGDTFARECSLKPLKDGDLVAFRSAGAYGAVMASEYNSRPLIPEVLVKNEKFAIIRPRPTIADLINRDKLPPWL